MLDRFEIDDMRKAIEELLPSTCNILSSTYTSDGAGGGTLTWGTATAAVNCRLDTKGGREQAVDGSLRSFNSLVLSMPYDTEISETNRVEFENDTFLVTNITPADTSWSLVMRVQLEKAS